MKREQVKCPQCGVMISKSNIKNHINSKTCLRNKNLGIRTTGICPYCNLDINNLNTPQRANHVRWCDKNPKRDEYRKNLKGRCGELNPMFGRDSWNKGLTKETNEIVRKRGESLRQKYKDGLLKPTFLGKNHSENTKNKIRDGALNSKHRRHCRTTVDYECIDGLIVKLDSSWEVKLAKILDENNIKWKIPEPVEWIDKNGTIRHYFPDFYLTEYDIYLDPKNDYAMILQEEKIKFIKNNYDNMYMLREYDLNIETIKKIIMPR